MSAEWEVQKVIFSTLDAALSVPVFDFVPQASQPDAPNGDYVTIGEDTFTPFETDGRKGFEGTLTIHTWNQANGRKNTKLLQGEIYEALNRAELAITGYNSIGISFEFSQTTLDPDGVTYHGVQRFRYLLMEQ